MWGRELDLKIRDLGAYHWLKEILSSDVAVPIMPSTPTDTENCVVDSNRNVRNKEESPPGDPLW